MFAECSVLAGLTLIVRTGRLKLRVRVGYTRELGRVWVASSAAGTGRV